MKRMFSTADALLELYFDSLTDEEKHEYDSYKSNTNRISPKLHKDKTGSTKKTKKNAVSK